MDQDEDEDYPRPAARLFDDDDDNNNDVGLFNPSHSDDENNKENDADADATKAIAMIDDLFGEITDGEDPFKAARAAAEKKHANDTYISSTPHEVLPSSSPPRGGGAEQPKEKKKPRPQKLDEVLLTSDTGFPALMRDMKGFELKGKGHEAEDLNRLLSRYQFWTQRMYPKSQFRDTVERVEKLCRSRLMHSKLTGWRNEALGISDPVKEEKEDSDNPKNDDADEDENVPVVDDNVLPPSDGPDANHSDAAAYASSSPEPPTRPPSSLGVLTDDDFNEEEMREAQQQDHELDDEDQWAMFDDDEVIPPPPKPTVDEDEFADEFEDVDMDVVMEQVEQKIVAKNNPDPPVPSSTVPLNNSNASVAAEDEDDIYL